MTMAIDSHERGRLPLMPADDVLSFTMDTGLA